ncbi:MAG: PH domain-containing protein [Oscillospiraceae bacterium]|nr:PH domain-containing protein [Oscillospiraceae bacterium]
MNKPQPQIVAVWRVQLFTAAFLSELLMSVILGVGGASWIILTSLIAIVFLAAYLVYFPLLYRQISFRIKEEKIIYTTGVFLGREKAVPLAAVQFVAVSQSILGRVFGLSSVIITAAGGRILIPGLKTSDAKALAEALNA